MNRVHQVNADSRFLYRVRKVILFGSFLTDAPFVGDLDLAVELDRKEPDGEKHVQMALARAREVAEKGRRFSNFVEMICFAEQEVKLFLKARSRIIQMTDSRDGILKMTEYRVIYEYPKDNPPASAA